MTGPLRWVAGGGAAALLFLAVAAGSRIPLTFGAPDSALIRLAWRTVGERVRNCRTLTPEEQERIPTHMRRTEECTSVTLPYRLTVAIDGRTTGDVMIHAAGARGDRPMFVFQEFPVAAGAIRLRIRYARAAEPPPGAEGIGETPPVLELDSVLRLSPGEILVVTYDPDRSRLVTERGTARAAP